jgi:hypothetical protein
MISVELLNSLRDGTPEADKVVDQMIAGLIAGETMRQTWAALKAEYPDASLFEQMRFMEERAPLFKATKGRA